MSKTAVAAPAAEPFDELFATIDQMDGPTLRAFRSALAKRYEPPRCEERLALSDSYSIRCFRAVSHDGNHVW